jgi:phage gpG-like protein
MAGFIEITFEVAGAAPIQSAMVSFGNEIKDLSPAWDEVGDIVRANFGDQFLTEGSYYGTGGAGWAPLAPSTIADRLRHGYGAGPILYRDGTLMESLNDKGAVGNINEIRADGASFGTQIPYARFHQDGTTRMPKRQIVGLGWDTRSAIIKALTQYVYRRVAANFPGTGAGGEE